MTDDRLSLAVRKCLAEFLKEPGPSEQPHCAMAAKHHALPVLVQQYGFVGLKLDGRFYWVNEGGAFLQDDDFIRHLGGIRAAQRYSLLGFMMPQRTRDAVVCPACSGSGQCEFGRPQRFGKTDCQCGGLGWIPSSLFSCEARAPVTAQSTDEVDQHSDVAGANYQNLLRFAADHGSLGSVVVRGDLGVSRRARSAFDQLAAHAVRSAEVTSWPSTTVFAPEPMAKIIQFPLFDKTLDVLFSHADSMFEWQQFCLPEDLSLYDTEERPWFVTIAHESEWSLNPELIDLTEFRKRLPLLKV